MCEFFNAFLRAAKRKRHTSRNLIRRAMLAFAMMMGAHPRLGAAENFEVGVVDWVLGCKLLLC